MNRSFCGIQVALLLLLGCFLWACASRIMSNELLNNIQNYIVLNDVSPDVVKDIRTRTNTNGLFEIEVILSSSGNETLYYKTESLDGEGFLLRNPLEENYREIRLFAGEEFVIKRVAHDKRVRTIRVILKS